MASNAALGACTGCSNASPSAPVAKFAVCPRHIGSCTPACRRPLASTRRARDGCGRRRRASRLWRRWPLEL
eukprot:3541126-Prymnesium_polylepis.1